MPLLILLVWAFAEIWLLIKVGTLIGSFNTVLLLIATAVLGLLLVQREWRKLAEAMQGQMQAGRLPLALLLESATVGLSGVLLLMPGFITDFLGLALLLPLTRKLLTGPLKKRENSPNYQNTETGWRDSNNKGAGRGNIIEGEYERKDDE